MIDIDKMRALTQAATPGPWHATKSVETNSWAVWSDTTRLMELRPTKTVDMYQVSNTAAFIAAANPAAISELLDRLEAAEKSDAESLAMYRKARDERDALRAKIEEMEKQEPVAWCATDESGTVVEALGMNQSRRFDTPLYLTPVAQAQPAPSVPEGFALVNAAHFLAVLDREDWRTAKNRAELRAMLAAAPEAKPCP